MSDESAKPDAKAAETIFCAALAFNATERLAYLAGACGDNQQLRQRVEALLSAHEQAEKFLPDRPGDPKPPFELATTGPTASEVVTVHSDSIVPRPRTEAIGDRIGRYKLREKIGEGGCGVVYVAEQEEPVRRRVALKVIKLGMDTRSVVARFEAERQALAMMDHPNIAKVFDAGATDRGRPFFVMELVRGIRITDFCDQNKLSTRERLDLFIKVCQAVQHAHQKGIIHRDLKPSNILVTLHDGVPVPKVIDFGIAKATEGRLTDLTIYTELHQFIGTPAYMSPEQAEMSGLDIDTRSDIYSLGVLLYEMLTGKTPFDSKDLMKAGLDEMRKTIREKEPVRPSTRLSTMLEGELTATATHRSSDPLKLARLLRGDLDWIVMKALEKDRIRRYETASGFAMDIQRHLKNEPVIACPPSAVYRFQKLLRRKKLSFAVAGAVAGSLLVLNGGFFLLTTLARGNYGHIEIDSVPPGAEVWAGQQRLGTTPFRNEKNKPGDANYELRLAGFELYGVPIRTKANMETRLMVVLRSLENRTAGPAIEGSLSAGTPGAFGTNGFSTNLLADGSSVPDSGISPSSTNQATTNQITSSVIGTPVPSATNTGSTNTQTGSSIVKAGGISPSSTNQAFTNQIESSVVLTVEGKVEWSRFGTNVWTLVQTNQLLFAGDRLRTGLKSRATIRLSNQGLLRVSQLTTLEIQPPAEARKMPSLNIQEGSGYFFNRDPISPALPFRTPQVKGEIKG